MEENRDIQGDIKCSILKTWENPIISKKSNEDCVEWKNTKNTNHKAPEQITDALNSPDRGTKCTDTSKKDDHKKVRKTL